jgi:hypothetical protein
MVALGLGQPHRPVLLLKDHRHASCSAAIAAFGVVVRMVKLRVTCGVWSTARNDRRTYQL